MINYSKINSESLIGKLLRLPLKLIPKSFIMPIVSGPLKGMKWRVGTSTHGCWLGTYELKKQRLIKKWLKPKMIAYDIGANAGIYTLLFSRIVGSQGQVYAFEAFGENTANILNHVHLNNLNNVVVVQVALSNKRGLSSFMVAKSNSMGYLESKDTQLRVPTITLNELINKFGLPIPYMIKIDVEGSELAVLEGATDLLKKQVTVWFIALHGGEQKKLCQDILTTYGYEIFTLSGVQVTGRLEDINEDEIYVLPRGLNNIPIKHLIARQHL